MQLDKIQLDKLEIDESGLSQGLHLTLIECALVAELVHKLGVKSRTKLIRSLLFREAEAQGIDVEAFIEDEVKRIKGD